MKAGTLDTNRKQGLNRTDGGRDDGRRETETLFQLTPPMSAMVEAQ